MQTVWEWLVAIYLFLGGLGAGAFLVAAALEFSGKRDELDFSPSSLVGAILPGFLVGVGSVLLILDLGAGLREPLRIFYMFTHFTSVMTWGIWILTIFIILALVYGFLEVLHTYPSIWKSLSRSTVRRVKRIVAAVGSVFAVGTAVYTGVLLSDVGPAIPFWSTPLFTGVSIPVMPFLFLFSAISTGIGLTIDLGGNLAVPGVTTRMRRLPLIHLVVILLEALLLALLLITASGAGGVAAQAVQNIAFGPYNLLFWIVLVLLGLAFPLVVSVYTLALRRHSPALDIISGVGILIAGLILRYLVLVNGIYVTL